jgi:hypothetical protein
MLHIGWSEKATRGEINLRLSFLLPIYLDIVSSIASFNKEGLLAFAILYQFLLIGYNSLCSKSAVSKDKYDNIFCQAQTIYKLEGVRYFHISMRKFTLSKYLRYN